MRLYPFAYLISLLALSIIPGCSSAAPIDDSSLLPNATGLIDSGFHPGANGFSFENYGNNIKSVDLTSREMGQIFGDKVFASTADGKYVPTFPAKRWMDEAIAAMESGHCEGMAVLSNLIYYGLVSPADFGGNEAIDLSIHNEQLQRQIGHWWSTQLTSPGSSNRIYTSPSAVLDALSEAFKDGKDAKEWWVIGIYMPDGSGGHSITPFAVEDMGNGTSRILVYDNNWPGDIRYVEVDTKANTWRYQASVNPDEPSTLYTGNETTQSLEIVSISPRLGAQVCDFCDDINDTAINNSKGGLTEQKRIQVWQDGQAKALVTDRFGAKVGFLESGKPINEISNAEIRNLKFSADSRHPPVIFMPVQHGSAPDINVTMSSATSNDEINRADTTIFAPGMAVAFSNPGLGTGQEQNINLTPATGGYAARFSTNQRVSPTITIETSLLQVIVSGANIEPGGDISVEINLIDKIFHMVTKGNIDPGIIRINVTSIDKKNGNLLTFGSSRIYLRPNDEITLRLEDLISERSIPSLNIDHGKGFIETAGLIAINHSDRFRASSLEGGKPGLINPGTSWLDTNNPDSSGLDAGSLDSRGSDTGKPDTINPSISTPGASIPDISIPGISDPGISIPDRGNPGISGPRTGSPDMSNIGVSNPGPSISRPSTGRPETSADTSNTDTESPNVIR